MGLASCMRAFLHAQRVPESEREEGAGVAGVEVANAGQHVFAREEGVARKSAEHYSAFTSVALSRLDYFFCVRISLPLAVCSMKR